MFCTNCGKEIAENSEFCSECGNKVVPEIVIKTKKRFNFKFGVVIIALICVAILGGVVYGAVNYITARNNVRKVLASAIVNVFNLSSFDFEASFYDGTAYDVNGSIKLGKDWDSSVFYCENDEDDVYAIYDGDMGWKLTYMSYYYGMKTKYYGYQKNFLDEIVDGLDYEYDVSIDVNKIVKNNHWDFEKLKEYSEIIAKATKTRTGYSIKNAEEYDKIARNFINKKCSKKEVWSKFIEEFEKSKSASQTTYSFTLDVAKLLDAFLDYIDEVAQKGSSKEKEAAEEWQDFFDYMYIDYFIDMKFEVDMEFVVNNKNFLEKLSLDFGDVDMECIIKNHNNSKIDESEVKSFMDKARREA